MFQAVQLDFGIYIVIHMISVLEEADNRIVCHINDLIVIVLLSG